MKRLTPLAAAFVIMSYPLNAIAQTTAFNRNVRGPIVPEGEFTLSRSQTLSDVLLEADGGFQVTNPDAIADIGYDPSRQWQRGESIDNVLRVDEADGLFRIKDLTPRQLAELSGQNVNQIPLLSLYDQSTIEDIVKLNPDLANAPALSIPAFRDLIDGNYSDAIKSGVVIGEQYSDELSEFLDERPELRDLPLRDIFQGDFRSSVPVATQTALRELSAKLPEEFKDLPAKSLPALTALSRGDVGGAARSGIGIGEEYSEDLRNFLDERPELRDLPLNDILQGDFRSSIPVAQRTALRELQERLPERFQDLPVRSLPALNDLRRGNIGGAVESGLEIAVDHFDTLENFFEKHPALEDVPIADLVNGRFDRLANTAEKLAFEKLGDTLPTSAQGFSGRAVPILRAVRRGDLNTLYSQAGSSVEELNEFLEENPHLKDLPLNQLLSGNVQAALPKAQQVAIYEISKRLPEEFGDLPGDALPALYDLKDGRWQNSLERGIDISREHFEAIDNLYKDYPELEGVSVAEVLRGDYDSLIDAGEARALKSLEKVNPNLADLPLGAIVRGDFDTAIDGGIKVGVNLTVEKLLEDNPALNDVALGVLGNPNYSLGSVEGLADTAIGAIEGIDGKLLSDVPGLNKIPLDVLNANNISALLKGDLFGRIDLVLGDAEKLSRNALSGFTRGKRFTPTNCEDTQTRTDHCGHAELRDYAGLFGGDGESLLGKQFMTEAHKGKGGWSFLKGVNGGYEPAGLSPWGVSAKSSNLKLIIKKVKETDGTQVETASGFRVYTESGYAEFGLTFGICIDTLFIDTCTPSFISLPTEFIPEELIDLKVAEGGRVLVATTSQPPRIPDYYRNIAANRYGLGQHFCSVPSGSSPPGEEKYGHQQFDEANREDLVEYNTRPDGLKNYVQPEVVDPLNEITEAAQEEGLTINVGDTHRTVQEQEELFQSRGGDESAARTTAPGGHSEHHTGYAVDFIDQSGRLIAEGSPEHEFLRQNAERFGFEQSFDGSGPVDAEAWHYRWTGNEAARQALRLEGGTAIASGESVVPGTGDAAISSVGQNAWGTEQDRANLIMTSIFESGGTQNQVDVAVSIMNRVTSSRFPNSTTEVVFAPGQYQPNFGRLPVSSKRGAIERIASRKYGGDFAAAQAEYESLEQALSNPQNIISAQNHIGGATDFRGFAPNTLFRPGDPYRGNPNNPNGQANFFVQESRSTLVATATLDRLGIGSDAFTGISDGLSGSGGGVPCVASSNGVQPTGPFSQGDGTTRGNFINPAPGPVTDEFGPRIHPVTGRRSFHKGIDIGLPEGTPVVAADGGTVIYRYNGCIAHNDNCGGPDTDGLGPRSRYGNRVEILHADGSVTAYNHLRNALPPVGSKVSQGQVIGEVGSTGRSTGPHLDFEVYPDGQNSNQTLNPRQFINF